MEEHSQGLLTTLPRVATWPTAHAISQRMLDAAREDDWILALRLFSERNALLVRFFADPVSEDEAPSIAESIKRTMEHDAELRRLSESGRSNLNERLQTLKTGRKARHVYLGKR